MKTNRVFGMFLVAAILLATVFSIAQASELNSCVYETVVPTDYAESINHWDPAETGSACVVFTAGQAGTIRVFSGWVFNAPLLVNGSEIPTRMVDGELAAQIDEISFDVAANSSLVFEPTWSASGTELGIRYSFTALEEPTQTPEPTASATPTEQPTEPPSSSYLVYLPLVANPPEVLKADGSSHLIQKSWPEASEGKSECLSVNFEGGYPGMLLSGWFFGTDPVFILNDGILAVSTHSDPGELATQIDPISLTDNLQTFKVCVKATGAGAEIGLRIKY